MPKTSARVRKILQEFGNISDSDDDFVPVQGSHASENDTKNCTSKGPPVPEPNQKRRNDRRAGKKDQDRMHTAGKPNLTGKAASQAKENCLKKQAVGGAKPAAVKGKQNTSKKHNMTLAALGINFSFSDSSEEDSTADTKTKPQTARSHENKHEGISLPSKVRADVSDIPCGISKQTNTALSPGPTSTMEVSKHEHNLLVSKLPAVDVKEEGVNTEGPSGKASKDEEVQTSFREKTPTSTVDVGTVCLMPDVPSCADDSTQTEPDTKPTRDIGTEHSFISCETTEADDGKAPTLAVDTQHSFASCETETSDERNTPGEQSSLYGTVSEIAESPAVHAMSTDHKKPEAGSEEKSFLPSPSDAFTSVLSQAPTAPSAENISSIGTAVSVSESLLSDGTFANASALSAPISESTRLDCPDSLEPRVRPIRSDARQDSSHFLSCLNFGSRLSGTETLTGNSDQDQNSFEQLQITQKNKTERSKSHGESSKPPCTEESLSPQDSYISANSSLPSTSDTRSENGVQMDKDVPFDMENISVGKQRMDPPYDDFQLKQSSNPSESDKKNMGQWKAGDADKIVQLSKKVASADSASKFPRRQEEDSPSDSHENVQLNQEQESPDPTCHGPAERQTKGSESDSQYTSCLSTPDASQSFYEAADASTQTSPADVTEQEQKRHEPVPHETERHRRRLPSESSSDEDNDAKLQAFFQKLRTPAKPAQRESDEEDLRAFIVDDSDVTESDEDVCYPDLSRRLDFGRSVSSEPELELPNSPRRDRWGICDAVFVVSDTGSSEESDTSDDESESDTDAKVFRPPHPRPASLSSRNQTPDASQLQWYTPATSVKTKPRRDLGVGDWTPSAKKISNAGTGNRTKHAGSWSMQAATAKSDGYVGSKHYSFLRSLSMDTPAHRRDPEAGRFISQFKHRREEISSRLFHLFNSTVFDNQLPEDMGIHWNKRLLKTAGRCKEKRIGTKREAAIELSVKVCDSAERVRDTLVHEMCHAAVWLINQVKEGHGPHWKYWARKANKVHPEIPIIQRCHDYAITTKYIYRCTKCGYQFGRHSKSLDTDRKICGKCCGQFELLLAPAGGAAADGSSCPTPRTPRTPGRFALFVKENYGSVKKQGLSHQEVMNQLSKDFAEKNKI